MECRNISYREAFCPFTGQRSCPSVSRSGSRKKKGIGDAGALNGTERGDVGELVPTPRTGA